MRDNIPQTSPVKMSNVVSRRERRLATEQKKLKKKEKEVVNSISDYLSCNSEHDIPETNFFFSSLVENKNRYDVLRKEKFCPRNSSHENFSYFKSLCKEGMVYKFVHEVSEDDWFWVTFFALACTPCLIVTSVGSLLLVRLYNSRA